MVDLLGLTNALTDIIVRVDEKELEFLGVKKGGWRGLSHIESKKLEKILFKKKHTYLPAGSPANVIFNASSLGLDTALLGTVGADKIGKSYIKRLEFLGITSLLNKVKGKSGFCYILVTPDGERTNIAEIGVAGLYNFNLIKLKGVRLFHTSGYEIMTNPKKVEEIIEYAKDVKTKISIDLADREMIRRERGAIERILEDTEILFATEEEAEELTGKEPLKSIRELNEICPIVALKKGSKGSVVRRGKEQYKIPVYSTKVKNTCGAGDAYASGFLFAYLKNFPLEECGHMGSYIASRVCSTENSHL